MNYKLGKLPARLGAVSFKFGAFFDAGNLPELPAHFGHISVGQAWGVLGNDTFSNCVFAGGAHETMVWGHEAKQSVSFTTDGVLSDYTAVTGFDRSNPASDQGTDMSEAAAYRRKTGLIDSKGVRHKVDFYTALRANDYDQLRMAVFLTGAAGIGIRFPASASAQFDAQTPWDPVKGSRIDGGHYLPCVGWNSRGELLVVTWGRLQAMRRTFYEEYCDEALGYFSLESLQNKLTPEGFDADQVVKRLATL